MAFTEAEVIAALKQIFQSADPKILVGIGDDAAVLLGSKHQVVTSDMAVEGVHFNREWSSAFEIGRKITAANVADLLAMNGEVDYLVAAVALTGEEDFSWIQELASGMKFEADLAKAHIVGGDLTRGPVVVISMTAIGYATSPILRSGASVGDDIYLSSLTGWSAAGLHLLANKIVPGAKSATQALTEFRNPTLDYAVDFGKATAMCDVSDSLLEQSGQLATASGVALNFEIELFELASEFQDLKELADECGADIWGWILGGGEDHVLLATGRELPGIKVGTVMSGNGVTGLEMKKAPQMWRHFT